MNKIAFVQIMIITARQYADRKQAIQCLEKVAGKVEEEDKEAHVLALMEAAHLKLLAGDVEGTKAAMEQSEKLFDSMPSVDTLIHASFYRVSADYNKAKAEYNQFYKNALLFLACVRLEDLSTAERAERAFDLAIAALLGDSIYNFGELLMHPILDALKGTPHEWLGQLLFVFNAGDLGKFDALSANFGRIPLLSQAMSFLRQKLCLMALIELVFKRSGDRRIPFAVIGQETRLPADEIEHLVMKALSLKLIKGKIDQVDQVVFVDWVQPRVLDKNQVAAIQNQMGAWKQKVAALTETMSTTAPELFLH
jgi:26S proteasome regulatory subunit N9